MMSRLHGTLEPKRQCSLGDIVHARYWRLRSLISSGMILQRSRRPLTGFVPKGLKMYTDAEKHIRRGRDSCSVLDAATGLCYGSPASTYRVSIHFSTIRDRTSGDSNNLPAIRATRFQNSTMQRRCTITFGKHTAPEIDERSTRQGHNFIDARFIGSRDTKKNYRSKIAHL